MSGMDGISKLLEKRDAKIAKLRAALQDALDYFEWSESSSPATKPINMDAISAAHRILEETK